MPLFIDSIAKNYSYNEKECFIAKNIIELYLLETSLTANEVLLNFKENSEINHDFKMFNCSNIFDPYIYFAHF